MIHLPLPFEFSSEYFLQPNAQNPGQSRFEQDNDNNTLPIVFPPRSINIPIATNVTETTIVKQQPMFHCGNKQHDSLFVCFYVLKYNAMEYHKNTRQWSILERQHKINFVEKLRNENTRKILTDVFSNTQLGKMDDELANTQHPTISVKTFVALCFTFKISVILVDDDLQTMTVIHPSDTDFPTHAVHIKTEAQNAPNYRNAPNYYIMWNECKNTQFDGYTYVNPRNLGFTSQLVDLVEEKEREKKVVKNKKTKSDVDSDSITGLKAISNYRIEELYAMCITYKIDISVIPCTGKGNKLLKKDLYDYISAYVIAQSHL